MPNPKDTRTVDEIMTTKQPRTVDEIAQALFVERGGLQVKNPRIKQALLDAAHADAWKKIIADEDDAALERRTSF